MSDAPRVNIVDSIAVRIITKDTLLTGVGNELHLHTATGTHVLSDRLNEKIHGITCTTNTNDEDWNLLVYGGKEFMLLHGRRTGQEFRVKLLQRARLTDWISAAIFLQNDAEFLLLTAHSVLLRISYINICGKQEFNIISKTSCIDKSTLYSSYLHGNKWENLVVFSGNAFGELLIWQPRQDGLNKKVDLKKRMRAHNGVIFSIDYNADENMLITTSDDRSVRFWSVLFEKNTNWQSCNIKPVASGYGHTARVFQGKFIKYKNKVFAVTVGEDSFFCLWYCNGQLMLKHRAHFGAVIWNFEYHADTQTLFTVGSTGNLLAYDLEDSLENKEILPSYNRLIGFQDNEYVAKAKFLNPQMLIGITNRNRLLYAHHDLQNADTGCINVPWRVVSEDLQDFKCTVLEVYKDYVVLCGYKRLIFFRLNGAGELEKFYDSEILNGIVRGFHVLNEESFLISDKLGNCLLLRGDNLMLRYIIKLPQCKEPWTTAALFEAGYLLLSNRIGNLLLYKLDPTSNKFDHIDTLKKPHGNMGATTLQLQSITNEHIFVRSAGHDGTIRLHCISKQENKLKSILCTVVPISWVEKILQIENLEIILGFNDSYFLAWSQMLDVTLQVTCGGGHRSWHHCLSVTNYGVKWLNILFVKNKTLELCRVKLLNTLKTNIKLPLRNQWHVRPCNIAALLEINANNALQDVLISAGDDNLVKISTLEENTLSGDTKLIQQVELHTHISNIRNLKVLFVDTENVLIISCGGRAQLCISRLNLPKFGVEELTSYMLNQRQNQLEDSNYKYDPDTRIMSCDIVTTADKSNYVAFLGCSDGFLRKLQIGANFRVTCITETFYENCILHVRVVADNYILVAGTTGKLDFYDLDLNVIPFQLIHHASGVNALDTLWEAAADVLHVLTGGDDQAVCYTSIKMTPPLQILKSFKLQNMHSAQVTAACLKRAPGKPLYAYTSGVDQNLIKLNVDKEHVMQSLHTCVADVKGLCVDSAERCFVYGCGIQVYEMKRND